MQTVDLNAPLPTGTTGDARSAPLKALAGGGSRYIADTAAASPTETPRKPSPIKAIKEIVDRETGEVLQFSRQRDGSLVVEKTPSQVLFLKWMRKAALAEIFGLKHRVSCCHRNPIKQATSVQVWAKLNAFIPGHFVGLQTCALPWLCPICSPKIAQRRSKEIQQAMDKCLANGGQVLMPTFTIPHGRQDPLSETLDLIKKALRWMSSHRQYKQLQGRLGVQGRIIATEMNHGEANGWHPHFHELWFFEGNGVDASKLEAELYVLWKAACAKFGLGEPSRQHGVDVQDGSLAAAYVAKMGDKPWTLADEMAKSISKKGRRSNLSFWELIDCYLDESVTTKRRNRAKQLIIEYAEATKGIKVLTWTRELKALYDVTERTDAEVAAQQEEEAVFIADISLDDWRIVARHRLQHLILGVCLQGRAAIYAVIDAYRNKSPKPLIRSITDSTSSHKSGGDPAEGGCQPCGVEASTEQPVSPGESGLVATMATIKRSLIAWAEYRNSYQKGRTHEETTHPVPAPRKVRHGRKGSVADVHRDSGAGEVARGQLGLLNLASYAAIRE
jgi:hypothetical protein